MNDLLVFAIPVILVSVGACSLKPADQNESVSLKIEITKEQPEGLYGNSSANILTEPGSINELGCYVINVTGPEIEKGSAKLKECESNSDFQGFKQGFLSPLVPENKPVEIQVKRGANRRFSVYGIQNGEFTKECGNFPMDFDKVGGYFLGSVVQDINESASLTIPISFVPGSPMDLKCLYSPRGQRKIYPRDGIHEIFYDASANCAVDVDSLPTGAPSSITSGFSEITAAEYPSLTPGDGAYLQKNCTVVNGSADTQVIYLSFNVRGFVTESYQSISLSTAISAGHSSSACPLTDGANLGTNNVGNFIEVYKYNEGVGSAWVNVVPDGSIPGGTAPTVLTADLAISPHFLKDADSKIWLRIAADNAGGNANYCSGIRLDYLDLILKP